jgi:hypothetical protein
MNLNKLNYSLEKINSLLLIIDYFSINHNKVKTKINK